MCRRYLLAGALVVAAVIGWDGSADRPAWGQDRAAGGNAAPDAAKPLPKALEAILRDWEVESSKVQTLEGELHRWDYNQAFLRLEEATGHFWYENPDKGRIDFHPGAVKPGTPMTIGNEEWTRHPYKEEQWVSDGQQVLKIDRAGKFYEAIPIPPENRGENIIATPLPFLFGLKAEQAKRRYDLELGNKHNQTIKTASGPKRVYHIIAHPKMPGDMANWQQAEVMLDPETFLPVSIKLVDPAASDRNRQEKAYLFHDVEINKPLRLLGRFNDPFKPELKGLQRVEIRDPAPNGGPPGEGIAQGAPRAPMRAQAAVAAPPGAFPMPRVINMPAKKVMETFRKSGYKVELIRGVPAPDPRMDYLIYGQAPAENTPIKPGETVTLTVHDAHDAAKQAKVPRTRD